MKHKGKGKGKAALKRKKILQKAGGQGKKGEADSFGVCGTYLDGWGTLCSRLLGMQWSFDEASHV